MKVQSDIVTPEVQSACRTKVDECMRVFDSAFPDIDFPPILVTFEPCGSTAAWAKTLQYQVNINPILVMENLDEYLNVIIGHEVSHIVSDRVYGQDTQDHGPEWASVMAILGLPPDRCHTLDTTRARRKMKTFKYQCGCAVDNIHHVSTRANRLVRIDKREFNCLRCNTALIPLESASPNDIIPGKLLHATKKEKAEWIIKKYKKKTRAEVIDLLIRGADLSKRGASTYYFNLSNNC